MTIKVATAADHRLAAYSHLVQAADRGTGRAGPAPSLQSPSLPGGKEQVGPVLLLASNLPLYLGVKNR